MSIAKKIEALITLVVTDQRQSLDNEYTSYDKFIQKAVSELDDAIDAEIRRRIVGELKQASEP